MKQTATLEKVREAYLDLEKQGENPSVRNIVQIVGGSNTTVTPLIRQIEEQRRKEKELNITMSDNFRQAYINDIHATSLKAREELERSLESVRDNEQDLLNDLSVAEDRIQALEAQISKDQAAAEDQARIADNRMASLSQKITDLEQERDRFQETQEQLQEQITRLRSDISEKELLLSQGNDRVNELRKEKANLIQQSTDQQTLIVELEKKSEIAGGRGEYLQEQVDEIKEQLERNRQLLDAERERRTEAEKQLAVLKAQEKQQDE